MSRGTNALPNYYSDPKVQRSEGKFPPAFVRVDKQRNSPRAFQKEFDLATKSGKENPVESRFQKRKRPPDEERQRNRPRQN